MIKALPPRHKVKQIGPDDNGRRMSLAEFDRVEGQEGYLYELNKGVVEVTNIPHLRHFFQLNELREQLFQYKFANPGVIQVIGTPDSTKLLIESEESERHPGLAVYTTSAPDAHDDVWSIWIPTVAVEIVSKSSVKRDYEDKPAEYLAFGISEYWIIDEFKKQMTALTRHGGAWREKVVKASQKYSTRHLPGFSLDLKRVFASK